MIGIHHFRSMFAAIRYYCQYCYKREVVKAKANQGKRTANHTPYALLIVTGDTT